MSVKYPDLPNTSYPNTNQAFPVMMDILQSDAPLIKQWHDAVQAQNWQLANSIWQQIPNVSQKIITSQILNTAFDTEVALEREFLERWSPAYVVSNTQPSAQETGDYWLHTGVVTY